MSTENIISFGSCLSRSVARTYKRLYSGDIVSSVYHNRSDYFLNCFLRKIDSPVSENVVGVLKPKKALLNQDEDAANILHNQTINGLGLHKIDKVENIFQVLSSKKIDLILIDNFIDVSGRLSTGLETRCFLRPDDYENYHGIFTMGDYISTSESVRCFNEIIDYFSHSAPDAKIFFLHFPYNTYEGDVARQARSLDFFKKFRNTKVTMIPPQSVPKVYRTDVASHYLEPQYAAYAGAIRALCGW